jgi:hypothetical protein|tara:strand:- start:607 stop:849 length:243 start_codon:yes stop_codon:yes gene_type:complete
MSNEEKQQHIINYVKSLAAIEGEMEPYKESRRELRKNYVDNDYLTRGEIRMAVKAYRMIQNDVDLEELNEMYSKLTSKML